MKEVKGWVTELIHSRTQDTKFFRIVDTYWLVKTLIGHVLKKNKEEKQDILHIIRFFEGKIEAMCKAVFGLRSSVA